ncbi:elongation factor Ts [Tieghemostelium lacteum]|uniref:Elongation factor Ts, mitochondrial n=1 Tax=Tieghemostelium lacteum TaxID=361077 RepID=A0A151Z6V5_TIELA|nr:elongation factor Ts [Tieghemostelium lacteum]|eukprot:KYQ89668.1 elongation factor Ts [Tieghemostelium lacteum]
MLKSINFVLRNQSNKVLYLRNYSTEAKVPVNLIKELREKTQAPLTDCKKALQSSNNDLAKAVEWLLEKGKATADKLKTRVSLEGLISVNVDKETSRGIILEINSETDFVARGESFIGLTRDLTKSALLNKDLFSGVQGVKDLSVQDQLLPMMVNVDGKQMSIADAITTTTAKLRENIQLRRASALQGTNKKVDGKIVVSGYAHGQNTLLGVGRLGSLVELEYQGQCNNVELLNSFAQQLAVHIVGNTPKYVSVDTVSNGEKADSDDLLLEQKFMFSNDGETVSQCLEQLSKQLGTTSVTVNSFKVCSVGEGIERKETDYQSEVMEKIKSAQK